MSIRRHEALHSTWVDGARDITVYTPPGYDEADAHRYPVLLLHDGQNLFEPDRAFVAGQHWQVAETADELILAGAIDPIVIVGVDHGQDARLADFTPTPGSGKRVATAGDADRYGRFLTDEVLPFVRGEYAVRVHDGSLGLGGSSLGGLVTIVLAQMYPSLVSRLLVMSPSVWWDRRVILRRLRRDPLEQVARVYLDVGMREGANTLRDARRLRDVLADGGAPVAAIEYVEDAEGDHSERSWGRRFGQALRFLYDRPVALDLES